MVSSWGLHKLSQRAGEFLNCSGFRTDKLLADRLFIFLHVS